MTKNSTVNLIKIREAVANYMSSEGCWCCQDKTEHKKHTEQLALLLGVPKYKDGSGYDFGRYRTKIISK